HPFPARKLRQGIVHRARNHGIGSSVSQRLGCPEHWYQFDVSIEPFCLIKTQFFSGERRKTGSANEIYCCDATLRLASDPSRFKSGVSDPVPGRQNETRNCSHPPPSPPAFPNAHSTLRFRCFALAGVHCGSDYRRAPGLVSLLWSSRSVKLETQTIARSGNGPCGESFARRGTPANSRLS